MLPQPGSLPPFTVGSVCGLGTVFKVQRLASMFHIWSGTGSSRVPSLDASKRAQSCTCIHLSGALGMSLILAGPSSMICIPGSPCYISGWSAILFACVVSWNCWPSLIASLDDLYLFSTILPGLDFSTLCSK